MTDQPDGARELVRVREVGRLLDLRELRELVDEFVAVARFQRVLRLQLRDHQFQEVVLAEDAVRVFGVVPALPGGGAAVAAAACSGLAVMAIGPFVSFRRARRRARRRRSSAGAGGAFELGRVPRRSRRRSARAADERARPSELPAKPPSRCPASDWPNEPMSRRSSDRPSELSDWCSSARPLIAPAPPQAFRRSRARTALRWSGSGGC